MSEAAGAGRRRLLFVNRFFHPDVSATSQMLGDLAVALAGDYRVAVACSRLAYDDPDVALPARETHRGVEIHRLASTRFGRASLAGRSLDYVSFVRSARRFVADEADERTIVIAMTDPPMLGAFLWSAARARGAVCVNWIQDLFPEVAEAAGLMRRVPGAAAPLRRIRNRALAHCALTVAVGERMAGRIRAACPSETVEVIPNWADGAVVRPMDPASSRTRRELGLDGKLVAGYSGNFGRVHEFETIVEAAALVADDPRIRFLLVGAGRQLDGIRRTVAARSLRNVVFAPYQPRERLADSLAAADVHFCTLEPRFEGLVVPSKIYGIMAAARPCVFIGDLDGEVARVVRRGGMGFNVAVGDCGRVASILRRLAGAPEEAAGMGRAARTLFEDEFELAQGVRKWKSALERAQTSN